MRALILSASALVLLSGSALAHPEKSETPQPKTVPNATFEMPSTSELEAAIDELPDLNAMLGDLMHLVKDDKLQKRMERAGEAFSEKMEKSGALEPDENGIPDIKLALKALVGVMSDEEVTGSLLDTVTDLQEVMEKYIPEDDVPAKSE